MFGPKKVDVLIAGAGPVGLLTALSLARDGVDVEIFEKSFQTTTRSYALALHPETIHLLEKVGLAREVFAQGREIERMAFYDGADRRAEISLRKGESGYPCIVLAQAALERLLEAELAKHDVHIHWNHRVARVTPSPDGPAAVTVAKLGKESLGYIVAETSDIVKREYEYEAKVVLGMDGYRSVVRQNLFIDFPEVGNAEIFAVFETELKEPIGDEVVVTFARGSSNVVWPMAGNGCRFAFRLRDQGQDVDPRYKSRRVVDLHDTLYPMVPEETIGDLVRERLPWFTGAVDRIAWSALLRFERRLAASFGRDNVWLAGDATHLASPVACLSMNVGLREALEIARLSAEVACHGTSPRILAENAMKRGDEWRRLFGLSEAVAPGAECDPWVSVNAARLADVIPASGNERRRLLHSLGLELLDRDRAIA